jgi:hypothetical protein
MAYAINVEQVVAGFVNTHKDGLQFDLKDVQNYTLHLWNCGVGPLRLNYTNAELENYLDLCIGVCLQRSPKRWKIDKSLLSDEMSPKEAKFLHNDKDLAKSFDLFYRLQVDIRTPHMLLDAMGFRFIYSE